MTPDTTRLDPFTIGDWLAEPKACRLSKGDIIVKLRPQLMDLLVCLARRPGEIVLKDEILAEVWPGQYIAESGLSRCVAELRQSLQDDAQHPTHLETVPKRGYRLIAPVARVEQRTRAEGDAWPVAPVQDAPGQGDPAAQGASRHGGKSPARRAAVWALLAAGLSVAVLAAVIALTRPPVSALTERDTVLLADVRNDTGDRVFDGTLRLALAVSLGQAPFLRILPDELIRDALVRAGRPADARVIGPLALDVCRREGAAIVLAPSIAPMGSRYAVGIEAVACGTGEEIARALEVAVDKERVLEALEEAATRIRRSLGESRDSLRTHNVPLVRATTPSLDALEALTHGDYYRDHARLAEAFALYRQATELDPAFALAWARRGAAAANLELEGEVIPAYRRAYELRARVTAPERFYITAGYYRMVEGDPDKTIEVYQAWKRMYPGSAVPPTNLASTLSSWMGRYEAALPEARQAVRLAPYSSLASTNLVVACLGSGLIEDARAAVEEAEVRAQDDLLAHQNRVKIALLDGDRAALDRETRWASASPASALWVLRARAVGAMAAGRLREARQLWSEAEAVAGEVGSAERLAELHLDRAEGEALLGDVGEARRAIQASLALDGGESARVRSAIVLALVGDPAGARTILDAIAPRQPVDPTVRRVWLPVALALTAAKGGRAAKAAGILQPAVRFEQGYGFNLVPLGVRALIAQTTGRPGDAAAAFGDLIRLHTPHVPTCWVPFARLSLARLLVESGEVAGSRAAYDAFLESWKGADPDAPLLAAARRERASVPSR